MKFGIIGSGSWATALAKILTDNSNAIQWLVRNDAMITYIGQRHHNPNYLNSVYFNTSLLSLSATITEVAAASDCIVIAVPSAYLMDTLAPLQKEDYARKKIISAVKGMMPQNNLLLNDYLKKEFNVVADNYFTVMGPCHAEEVASEKLSYLTFSGTAVTATAEIASYFKTDYINTIINDDIYGVQYAAILKNIYALGAGIAHGLDYGDNFLSVLIANSADEMAGFLRKTGIKNLQVGSIEHHRITGDVGRLTTNYAASVYLGDLLVTCYSLYSRNRTFGNMIGKGYSVKAAQLEMNMVAEGYNAANCIYNINKQVHAEMPIAEAIYKILWQNVKPADAFKQIEQELV
jgi:glycerol-3-phosphate dehydrogenase (NAD(P)+)